MTTAAKPDLYGLVGHPVAHSRSRLIHRRFAAQTGEGIEYLLIDVAPGAFDSDVTAFRERGGKGLNVTLPYKGEAFQYVTRLTDRARTASAVNTLMWHDDGTLLGDNTDGAGLVTDLHRNLGINLAGQRILLMGAGGAARGAIAPLLATAPARLVIANRTVARATVLETDFARFGPLTACAYDALNERFDLIVNATSASLADQMPPLPAGTIGADTVCYDMYYTAGPTAFLRWAAESGCRRLADGTGMLVEQAAESFELWRGIRPDTAPVLTEIRRALS